MNANSSRRRRRLHRAGDEENPQGRTQSSSASSSGDMRSNRKKKHGERQCKKLYSKLAWIRTSTSKMRALIVVGLVVVASTLLMMISTFSGGDTMWGRPGFDPEGGLAGRMIDKLVMSTLRRHYDEASQKPYPTNATYPLLSQRNNRDKNTGSSPFLDVVLNLELGDASADDASTHNMNQAQHRRSMYDLTLIEQAPSLLNLFLSRGCNPSWLCHRCLVLYDNPNRCPCHPCYQDILCNEIHNSQYIKNSPVHVMELMHDGAPVSYDHIPRIIHQVGEIEWLDSTLFPDLVRLQNSWRMVQNASYRYHTPETGIEFVKQHYSSLESLFLGLSSEEQRSLLGLLAVYHYGGILANVDLLLEVNLETIWEKNASFVAAAAMSPPYDNECLFLWGGFVAASPRHPTVGLAIILNVEALRIQRSQRIGLVSMWESSSHCDKGHDNPPSDTRCDLKEAFKGDSSRDSYLLGKAYRETIWESSREVARKDTFSLFGRHRVSEWIGTSHILLISESDAGATRLTDVESDTLIASTSLVGIHFLPMGPAQQLRQNS